MKVEAESLDDRSGGSFSPRSFGYVYFTDGSRVGYAPGLEDTLPVWQPRTNGNGRYVEVSMEHFVQAFQLLRKAGIIDDTEAQRMRELVRA